MSENAGSTWTAIGGQPRQFLPHKGKLSPAEKALYISYADGSGPYDGTNGSVYRYDITAKTWKDISPVTESTTYFGYGGLAVDLQKPGTIMVASLNSWYPDVVIFRSTDSVSFNSCSMRMPSDTTVGYHVESHRDWNGYPNINYYYGMTVRRP